MPPIVTVEVDLMTFQCLSFQEDIRESVCFNALLGEFWLDSGETTATLPSRQTRMPFPFAESSPSIKEYQLFEISGGGSSHDGPSGPSDRADAEGNSTAFNRMQFKRAGTGDGYGGVLT